MSHREVMQQALEALEILLQTPTARRQAWDGLPLRVESEGEQ